MKIFKKLFFSALSKKHLFSALSKSHWKTQHTKNQDSITKNVGSSTVGKNCPKIARARKSLCRDVLGQYICTSVNRWPLVHVYRQGRRDSICIHSNWTAPWWWAEARNYEIPERTASVMFFFSLLFRVFTLCLCIGLKSSHSIYKQHFWHVGSIWHRKSKKNYILDDLRAIFDYCIDFFTYCT